MQLKLVFVDEISVVAGAIVRARQSRRVVYVGQHIVTVRVEMPVQSELVSGAEMPAVAGAS